MGKTIKAETNYAKYKAIMAEYGEDMDLNTLASFIEELKDVLKKHTANYKALQKEYHRLLVLMSRLRSGALCPCCHRPLYFSDMRRVPKGHVCIHCDEIFSENEVEFQETEE